MLSDSIDSLYAELRCLQMKEALPGAAKRAEEIFLQLRKLQEEEAVRFQRKFESRLHLEPGTGWQALENAKRLLEDASST